MVVLLFRTERNSRQMIRKYKMKHKILSKFRLFLCLISTLFKGYATTGTIRQNQQLSFFLATVLFVFRTNRNLSTYMYTINNDAFT